MVVYQRVMLNVKRRPVIWIPPLDGQPSTWRSKNTCPSQSDLLSDIKKVSPPPSKDGLLENHTHRSLFLFPCLGLWRISLRTVAPWMSNEEFSSLMELRTTSPAKHQADGFVPPKNLGEYHGIPGRLIKSGTFFSGWVAVAWSSDHPTVHCRSRNLGVSSFVRGICILK